MKVTNYDRNGNLIEDMSKIVLPEEKQKQLIRIIYSERLEVKNAIRFEEKEISS